MLIFILSTIASIAQVSDFTLSSSIKTDGLFFDNDTLYVAEGWSGSRVFKISPDGEVTIFCTNLDGPIDVVRKSQGNFYVSEWNSGRIAEITPMGVVSSYVSVSPGPGPMALDKEDNIYVTHNINNGSGSITRIDTAGNAHPFYLGPPLNNPGGIDFDESGKLYVANFNNGNIIAISPTGQASLLATIPVSGTWKTAHIKYHAGLLYVNSLSGNRIFTVDTIGQVSVFAGSGIGGHLGGPLLEARFSNPDGLCLSPDGKILWVAKGLASTSYFQKIDLSTITDNAENPLSTFSFQLVPNPTNEQVTLDLRLRRRALVSFQIFTNDGQLVLATTGEERAEGPCSIRVDCQSWDNGWYVAVLSVDGAIFKKSFLIQKGG